MWVPWDPWGDPWIPWGDRWDLGTDETLGPMGPGPQGPPILPQSCFIDTRPGPARLGRSGLAAGPGASCQLLGRP